MHNTKFVKQIIPLTKFAKVVQVLERHSTVHPSTIEWICSVHFLFVALSVKKASTHRPTIFDSAKVEKNYRWNEIKLLVNISMWSNWKKERQEDKTMDYTRQRLRNRNRTRWWSGQRNQSIKPSASRKQSSHSLRAVNRHMLTNAMWSMSNLNRYKH